MLLADYVKALGDNPSAYIDPELREWERKQIAAERAEALISVVRAIHGTAGDATELCRYLNQAAEQEWDADEWRLEPRAEYERVEQWCRAVVGVLLEAKTHYRAGAYDKLYDLFNDMDGNDDVYEAIRQFKPKEDAT